MAKLLHDCWRLEDGNLHAQVQGSILLGVLPISTGEINALHLGKMAGRNAEGHH
jgi:hypothetical protein